MPSVATGKLVARARDALASGGAPQLLDSITWPRSVERAFFAAGAEKLPEPVYEVDHDAVRERIARLDAFEAELSGDDALVRLLRSTVNSQRLGSQMLLVLGTRAFYDLAREVYGGARSTWLDGDTTNLDFAEHIAGRIGKAAPGAEGDNADGPLDAAAMAAQVEERLAKRRRAPEVRVEITDEISAKAIAGRTRLRLRSDATFDLEEARSLYLHEVETHLFTAQNGAAQPVLSFLHSGGPCSTRTQEGLAVFVEFYSQALTLARLRRLVERVRLVSMAEDGATFLDLYRHLVEAGRPERSAYLDASRICRGGLCTGGAPFPKDAAYLSGFVEVYDFLRLAVTHDRPEVAEVLVSGRFSLDDVESLVELRKEGVLAPPEYLPSWVRRHDDLLTHFAFTSFLADIDLRFVGQRYPWL
ncbi:MAG: DUF1704 domain-containing protein [Polyangiaceae bacterium]|nr:DUF1704 domain-containing protein [Polyangiaceae bacterium]